MKNYIKIVTLAWLVTAATIAQADVILQDNFTYLDGPLTNVSSGKWVVHSGNLSGLAVQNGAAQIVQTASDDVNAALANGPYTSSSTIAALYFKFTVNFSALPGTSAGGYFAHFKDASTGFRARVFANTTGAAAGSFRLGIANAAGSLSSNLPVDLTLGSTYTVVTRYDLATGISTLWVDPANEASASARATDSPNLIAAGLGAFGLRQTSGEGVFALDELVVGTKFADVIPASAGHNPPFITKEPADANAPVGTLIDLSVIAGGDTPTYQWRKNDVDIPTATTSTYSFSPAVAETAGYSVVIANAAGSITSRVATVTTTTVVVAPSITTQPESKTVTYGENAVFSVVASGTEPLTYQWTFNSTNLPGGTAAFYTVSGATPADAGPYQVIVTNSAGSATSQVATLTVTAPPATNIAYLRSLVDVNYLPTNTTSRFTVEGIVTSWNNLTSGTNNALFYFQDSTAGIAVFYGGGFTNLPAAGSRVRITATLSHFNGLLEMMPNVNNQLDSVTVISTGNPLPAATAVPFDVSQSDPIVMEAIEGKYVVASNVFLANPGSIFTSVSAGEFLTNNLGETFNMYINAYTDIPSQTKPFGPVTVFGVMGQFDSSNPRTSGYQMIPTRYDDIISQAKAARVVYTNYLSNLARPTGLEVNSLAEGALRPGESLRMEFTATDPDNGSVTITPLTTGLPAEASWSIPSPSGITVTGSLTFTPTAANAGIQYTFRLRTQTTTALATNTWIIYVPKADEQQVFITEIYPNPTSSTNSPAYNPLHRAEPVTSGTTTADEYIEIVNLSSTDFDLFGWTVADAVGVRHRFYNGSSGGETLPNHNAIIVYGGPLSGNVPTLPVSAFPASESSAGLALNNTGNETITLRNATSNIVDRILYTGGLLSASGSVSRFPTLNDWFVPQPWINVNNTTAGLQYDGGAWSQPTKVPVGTNLLSVVSGNPLALTFTASTTAVTTLWRATSLPGPFTPVAGQLFTNTAGVFYITNPIAPQEFYGITTQ